MTESFSVQVRRGTQWVEKRLCEAYWMGGARARQVAVFLAQRYSAAGEDARVRCAGYAGRVIYSSHQPALR